MAFQTVVVLLLAAAAATGLVLQAQRASRSDAKHRSSTAAETFALSPATVQALSGPDPSAVLQPWAEQVRSRAQVDFVVVVDANGVYITHPLADMVGTPAPPSTLAFIGKGRERTEVTRTPRGSVVNASVPVRAPDGRILGTVIAGITAQTVGSTVDDQIPLLLGGTAGALVLSAGVTALVSRRLRRQTRGLGPAEMTRMYEHHDAVLHSVREGVLIVADDGRLLLANDEARRLLDLPADAESRAVGDLGLGPDLVGLLASPRAATDEVYTSGDRLVSVNKRPTVAGGGSLGYVVTLRDTTELRALAVRIDIARERLGLLYEAGVRVGTTLDVERTAEELAEVAVPRFADVATVDLLDPVFRGEEAAGARLRRAAVRSTRADPPVLGAGERTEDESETPDAVAATGRPVLHADLGAAHPWSRDPELAGRIAAFGIHSLVSVPLRARGVTLGAANFWRAETPEPFDDEDLAIAEELAARAALSIDNARRFTREHTLAVALQRSLLPHELPAQSALDIAYRYLPASAGVGGDWFDVVPLSGARVALTVGDVVGHGLHAAATMGRLRTAARNFAMLDQAPDELLGHMDELVARSDLELTDDSAAITGATCLYAIYDPVTGRLAMARAGHLNPALVLPDGRVEFPDIPVSPPLGLAGSLPIETAELDVPEGTRLVMFTDGLVENRRRDLDTGLRRLHTSLAAAHDLDPDRMCSAVLDDMLPARPVDDVALLIARTRRLDPGHVAVWTVHQNPEAVAPVRAACARQLGAWGFDDIAFSTELILSELITNAIRYGRQPIQVRLLLDRTLTCEVSDGSSTAPHLRRATTTDEGGRGLFLVAQFAARWGTRYTPDGKVIWAEQDLDTPPPSPEKTADALLEEWDDAAG
ncbi:SpoIIE family protein phosphatase [Yinghuangia sp. ASG 101]|nr:SpoIIE family protein phosphatase [Yinghuangia sp. ASG 101]UGQ15280.1 SpoIIE family protein phosphatase [Yinghuangia sp. ASG 101]